MGRARDSAVVALKRHTLSFENFDIPSPKQTRSSRDGWDAFFPYYAGYPAAFATSVIGSARLPSNALVLDPWNGSGTTTQVASRLGFRTIGCDINPVMVVVSRARCLRPADGDSLVPLTTKVVAQALHGTYRISDNDPLLGWFDAPSAESIRCIELSIREHLLGAWTIRHDGTHFEYISSLAATFYVALFLTCRSIASNFQSSNPTWLRKRKAEEPRITIERTVIVRAFQRCLDAMANQLATRLSEPTLELRDAGPIEIRLSDSTEPNLDDESVDFVLTSPPYCTRIDYTAATRIELAILAQLLDASPKDLSRKMIGTTRVPLVEIPQCNAWGETCNKFLDAVRMHKSKASSGYYFKTHLDYFDKLSRSLRNIASALKNGGKAVLVVQDSYYKDLHNDLPTIVSEIANLQGLIFLGAKEFRLARSMSGVNPFTRVYKRKPGAVEAVLCFLKQ